jgi:hypothetical protein
MNTLLRSFLFFSLTLLLLGSLNSCGTTRGLSNEHADLVAWYIEDVIRGAPRQSDELVLSESTPAMTKIAGWLAGSDIKGKQIQPRLIENRQKRWSSIHSLFSQKLAVVLNDGLLAPAPGLSQSDQRYIFPLVDAENMDRRSIDALVISMSDCNRDDAKRFVSIMAAIRLSLDTKAGAQHWEKSAAKDASSGTIP